MKLCIWHTGEGCVNCRGGESGGGVWRTDCGTGKAICKELRDKWEGDYEEQGRDNDSYLINPQ